MKTIPIRTLVLGAMSIGLLAVTTGSASAEWYYDGYHHRHWREHRVYVQPQPYYVAPPPVVYAPPPPRAPSIDLVFPIHIH